MAGCEILNCEGERIASTGWLDLKIHTRACKNTQRTRKGHPARHLSVGGLVVHFLPQNLAIKIGINLHVVIELKFIAADFFFHLDDLSVALACLHLT